MSDFIKIAILDNEVQANLLQAMLEERNIPFQIRSYHDFAYDGLFQSHMGWGHVEAPAEYHQEILDLLTDMNRRGDADRG